MFMFVFFMGKIDSHGHIENTIKGYVKIEGESRAKTYRCSPACSGGRRWNTAMTLDHRRHRVRCRCATKPSSERCSVHYSPPRSSRMLGYCSWSTRWLISKKGGLAGFPRSSTQGQKASPRINVDPQPDLTRLVTARLPFKLSLKRLGLKSLPASMSFSPQKKKDNRKKLCSRGWIKILAENRTLVGSKVATAKNDGTRFALSGENPSTMSFTDADANTKKITACFHLESGNQNLVYKRIVAYNAG